MTGTQDASAASVLRLHDLDGCRRNVAAYDQVIRADAEYVLAWLRQSEAPDNIAGLQERIVRALPDRGDARAR